MNIGKFIKDAASSLSRMLLSLGSVGILERLQRYFEYCDPTKPDPCNTFLQKEIVGVSLLLSWFDYGMQWVSDESWASRAWNISVDVLAQMDLLLLFVLASYTAYYGPEKEMNDATEFAPSMVSVIILALLLNPTLQEKLLNKCYKYNDKVKKSFDFSSGFIRGIGAGRSFIATCETIHDNIWSTETKFSTIGKIIQYSFGSTVGFASGYLTLKYGPNKRTELLFPIPEDNSGMPEKINMAVLTSFKILTFVAPIYAYLNQETTALKSVYAIGITLFIPAVCIRARRLNTPPPETVENESPAPQDEESKPDFARLIG